MKVVDLLCVMMEWKCEEYNYFVGEVYIVVFEVNVFDFI